MCSTRKDNVFTKTIRDDWLAKHKLQKVSRHLSKMSGFVSQFIISV